MVISGQVVIKKKKKKKLSEFLLFTNASLGNPGKGEWERGFFPKAKHFS